MTKTLTISTLLSVTYYTKIFCLCSAVCHK